MLQNFFYNTLIKKTTLRGYGAFFEKIAPNSRILDIGIGNGLMLRRFHEKIRQDHLQILGLDVNPYYLKQSRRLIRRYELEPFIQVEERNFLEARFTDPFDYIFFSMSFPLIQEKRIALENAKQLLREEGALVFFQTMQFEKTPLTEFLKPRLKYLCTVDFGRVNYENDFQELLNQTALQVVDRTGLLRISSQSESQLIFVQPKKDSFPSKAEY